MTFDWAGAESRIALRDDGRGMTEPTLVQAMRPGSTSPRERREAHDLGRFGLGLKDGFVLAVPLLDGGYQDKSGWCARSSVGP